MIHSEINQLIIDNIKEADAPQHIKDFVIEILRHESSVFEEFEAGGTPRYSKVYENLLNKYVRDQIKATSEGGEV
jgi:hypothetical protein